jgi:pectin methylesterase-like acyl-CoA thioesterase
LSDGATGNGSTISGSTTSTLSITNAQAADSGTYSLIASNSAGVVTNSMTLTVSSSPVAPGITGPTDQTVIEGSNATFAASVSGLPIPTLRWLENGITIPGETTSTLVLAAVSYAKNGNVYSLIASNSAGVVTNSATLTVLVPTSITAPPTNVAVVVGSPVVFNVTAGGVPAPSYQWNRNGSPIGGATSSSYTLSNPQGVDNGAVFSVTVSNSVNSVTSSGATLTVLSTMTGTFLPTNGAVNISPDQQLRIVFADGSPRLNTNGTFTVRDAADNSLVQTIDASQFLAYTPGNTSIQTIPNAAVRFTQGSYSGTGAGSTAYYYMPIALYGNEAWITLTNRLAYGHTYYATCDTGLFLDANGASFSGIAGTNTWRLSTKASGPATPTINGGPTSITVGQDGIGDFATFQGAFDWIPQSNTLARTVHVLPGIYRDSATLAGNRNFVTIVGDGASRTNVQLIYPFIYFAPPNPVFTAGSLRIESSDVSVENLTVDNIIYGVYHPTGYATSGAAGAFAGAINTLATTGKRIVFDNVLIKGGQDTVFNISGVVYYHNCEVWGSVDFLYGAALQVYDQCNVVQIRSTGGPITAPNTAYAQPYGITFLNCTFPQALVANGYPYDVGTATTTFMRPWGKDGMTAAINCALGNQFNTMGWDTMGNTNETTCRAREYGTTMIGGGSAPTIAQRQAAGAYWLNTVDPDYTNNPSLNPWDPLVYGSPGTNNRVAVAVNPSDYTLSAIFGNSYFNLNGWMPAVLPTITSQPTNQTVNAGATVTLSVAAVGLPQPTFQWLKNGTNVSGANSSTLTISGATAADSGNYTVVVSNSVGSVVSTTAVVIVAPNPPTGLIATGGEAQVSLSWNASSGATSYNVKRATVNGGPYTTISNITTTGYTDSSVVNGTTYYYVVSALNAGGESANSAQASATPQTAAPSVPTGLTAAAGNAQAVLSWTAASGATSYNVKRSLTSGSGYATVTNVTGTSVVDSGLSNGTTYYYVVSALSAGGESENSGEVSVTPTDLFGYWKFDETSGTTAADSSGGNPGTLQSGATWTSGIISNAVHLDGTTNGYLSFPAGLVGSLNDFSVSTWVKLDTNATWSRVFDFGSGTSTYMFLSPASGSGTMRYAITTSGGAGEQQINSSALLSTGIWHHVAVTLSGTLGILYVDGAAVGTNSGMTLKPSSLGNTTQNYIGKSQYADPNLNGSMDDFRIYNHALSASEVSTLADAGLPSPWSTLDIGVVVLAGAADFVNGTYTIQGAGTNIAGGADAFRFVYQPSSGDCSNTIRVASIQNTGANAKAGVMIRESLAANAREAGIWVTPGSGIIFTYRSSTGGSTTVSTSTGKTAPYWVRIARVGNSFRAYYSANGTTWTQLGSKTINMATSAYIGMGVESGTNALNTATMDSTTTIP